MNKIKNPPRDLPPRDKPFHGLTNTDKKIDFGAPYDIIEKKFDMNRHTFGVQSRPREFQPFFRFGGSDRGTTITPIDDHNVLTKGNDVGQPRSLAYNMERQSLSLENIPRHPTRMVKK